MNTFARFRGLVFKKKIDTPDVGINKTCGLHDLFDAFEIRAADENIDIASVALSRFVDSGHPTRNSVAADDRIINACTFQYANCACQSRSNLLHGTEHPFECWCWWYVNGHE